MEKKKPRHLTASGQIKPSVRLASRSAKSNRVAPTVIAAAWVNRMHADICAAIAGASTDPMGKPPSAVIRQAAAKECLAAESAALTSAETFKCAMPAADVLSKISGWRLCVRNIGLDEAMLFAVKHRTARACLKLKKSFYASSYAVCTQVYRFVRRIERMLGAVHDGSLGVLMQFVLVKIRRLFFHLSQFLFEVTFAIGHRRMLLLEREALALDVHQAFVHVADDLDD